MIIRWHGQSAYTLTGVEHTVAIDPFGPRRLRPGRPAPRAARRHRGRRPRVRARGRRADHWRRRGGRDRPRPGAGPRGPDALPHAGERVVVLQPPVP